MHLSKVKPAFKIAHACENVGQKEIQKTPQFTQVVLKRSSCKRFFLLFSKKVYMRTSYEKATELSLPL